MKVVTSSARLVLELAGNIQVVVLLGVAQVANLRSIPKCLQIEPFLRAYCSELGKNQMHSKVPC